MKKYQFIPQNPKGRRFVIGDIHGCLKTFEALVSQFQFTENDQLFLLGDYINRGPDSLGVIAFIRELQKKFEVYPLRGNHEQMLLGIQRDPRLILFSPQFRKFYDRKAKKVKSEYFEFFNVLPYCIETEGFYLVHAGLNFKAENPLDDYQSMLWIREFEASQRFLKGKKIVHGHTHKPLSVIQEAIEKQHLVIPLDNGCYKKLQDNSIEEKGNLCGLELNTQVLFVQQNID